MTNKKLLGVDVDGTLTKETCWNIEEVKTATPRLDVIEKVNKLYDSNFIVIYTARRRFLTEATLDWLDKHGVKYHAYSHIKVPFEDLIDDHVTHVNDIDTLLA
jgi:uncharacterized HAD superfamily protein